MIFTLSKNVLSFDETLQSHKYFWLQVTYMVTLHFIYTI